VPFTPSKARAAAASAEERGDKKKDTRPTPDQMYLASRVSETAPRSSARLSVRALQKLNTRYGVQAVTDALRCLRGFPPDVAVRSPYAYVVGIIEGSL
jgi:hypothetical protein